MKILIITHSRMGQLAGGMERVLVNFANVMHERGATVVLAYCAKTDEDFFYPLNEQVKKINILDLDSKYAVEIKKKPILFKIKREILRILNRETLQKYIKQFDIKTFSVLAKMVLAQENPDIIISSSVAWAPMLAIADKQHKYPVITMCHNDAESLINWMSGYEQEALAQCDALQVLMPHDIRIFRKALPNTKLVWIPNVVPQVNLDEEKSEREKLIINVARLEKIPKRQYLLVEAFAEIAEQFPEWKVELWGDKNGKNDYTKELNVLINKCHLGKRIQLCGQTNEILTVYKRASIFAFPSLKEGFPLAMTEAMSAGLPVVAYRSCPAVNELVQNGKTGLLVDDGVDALAEGLKKLMGNEELREHMGGQHTKQ